MKTEAELRAALNWFMDGTQGDGSDARIRRQDFATQHNILGSACMLEWVLGLAREGNPVPGMLTDIAAMQAGPERN